MISDGVKRCRSCGGEKKTYGVLDEPKEKRKEPATAKKPRIQRLTNKGDIAPDEAPAVSTFKKK
jgi:hypothetical protein